jgi:hypothetical protein
MKRMIHQRLSIMKEVNPKFRDEYNKVEFKAIYDKITTMSMYNSAY